MNNTGHPGLYVHTPFCATKCPYCDFYSVTDLTLMDAWVSAVLKEASAHGREFTSFDSLYIGGGTPSVLNGRLLERLMAGLRDTLSFRDDTEVTMELNPDDVTKEKLDLYASLGVNRISLGVQSFSERELEFLGRRHRAIQARKAAGMIAGAGFRELSIDLMYGLPGQRTRRWVQNLEAALAFGPAHMSCYQLTIEGETPFSRKLREGQIRLPGERRQAELFLITSQLLTDRGFIHYEVSNYAAGKDLVSRHNSKYWQHTPYLGLGPSAHSFHGRTRWWNRRSIEGYLTGMEGKGAAEGTEILSDAQYHLEELLFGFRTRRGIDAGLLSNCPQKRLDELVYSGFMALEGGRVVPTTKGFLFADRLPLMVSG